MANDLDSPHLLELVAESMFSDPSETAFENERLAAWLAGEATARQTTSERGRTRELARRSAYALRVNLSAKRFSRRRPIVLVRERAALVYGVASQLMRTANAGGYALLVEPRIAAGAGRDIWDATVESWVEIPPGFPRGDYLALPVSGKSMMPCIEDGSVILVRIGQDIAVDDVIVARTDDGYVVKHVSRLTRNQVELSSFNPDHVPFTIERSPDRILGTVVARLAVTSE